MVNHFTGKQVDSSTSRDVAWKQLHTKPGFEPGTSRTLSECATIELLLLGYRMYFFVVYVLKVMCKYGMPDNSLNI